jgi:hypothetical protein
MLARQPEERNLGLLVLGLVFDLVAEAALRVGCSNRPSEGELALVSRPPQDGRPAPAWVTPSTGLASSY